MSILSGRKYAPVVKVVLVEVVVVEVCRVASLPRAPCSARGTSRTLRTYALHQQTRNVGQCPT